MKFWLSLALLVAAPTLLLRANEDLTFASQIDRLRCEPEQQSAQLREMLAKAEELAASPIQARVYSLADMGRVVDGKRYPDNTAKANATREKLGDALAEQFSLASSDAGGSRYILNQLPLLAAALRLTGSPTIREHLIAQLEEITTWVPFQRPGWTLSARTSPLPPEGDGVWLATGASIQGLVLALSVLEPDAIPSDLRQRLDSALEREMKLIAKDWLAELPWYVKSRKIESNQWIVPASGMVIAAAYLGREKFPEIYQLGVDALRESLKTVGTDGSMSEGHGYAFSWSSISLMLANRFMLISGDDQFADHPFFQKFPTWVAAYFQPGGYVVNAFDWFSAPRDFGVASIRAELNSFAAITEDPGLLWLVDHVTGGPSRDFFGLLVLALSNEKATPPVLFGLFERSHAFIWRSSWDFNASGLWVRGGDDRDFHDHWDRGHVNLILHGKAVLIEAGTPGYANPKKKSHYDSLLGHNVLQVGSNTLPDKTPAPIRVQRADAEGGRLTISPGAGYPDLSSWTRTVEWTPNDAKVADEVLTIGEKQPMLFRWHVGSIEDAIIEGENGTFKVRVPAGSIEYPAWIGKWELDGSVPTESDVLTTPEILIEFHSDKPIRVSQEKNLDHLFKFRRQEHLHTTIVVEISEPDTDWRLETRVKSKNTAPDSYFLRQ